jgi:hypothetical protein
LLEEEEPLKLEELPEREVELTGEGAAVSDVGQWRRHLGGWCASGWAVFFVFFFQTIRVKEGLDPVFY